MTHFQNWTSNVPTWAHLASAAIVWSALFILTYGWRAFITMVLWSAGVGFVILVVLFITGCCIVADRADRATGAK